MNPRTQIERDIRALALPRGRRVGQPGHDFARDYLLSRLTEIGLAPFKGSSFELPYTASHPGTDRPTQFTNLVGVIRGNGSDPAPLLVGAHYDSVIDGPCADDNAAAVAVVLAIAQRFVAAPLRRDLVVAIFDAEEPPYFLGPAMGSVRFYEDHCAGLQFACAIIMDLIGHDVEVGDPGLRAAAPHLAELLFVLGAESHQPLAGVVERAAGRVSGLRVLAALNDYIGDMSDHHAFRLGGEPYLFLSCGQGRFYHDMDDSVEWINFDKVARAHELVCELLLAADSIARSESIVPHDPYAFEIRLIERSLGPALPLLLSAAGLPALSTRSHLNHLARFIQGSFKV